METPRAVCRGFNRNVSKAVCCWLRVIGLLIFVEYCHQRVYIYAHVILMSDIKQSSVYNETC
jgi:hypothetical protein